MNEHDASHEEFEELAAVFALDALESDEAERFASHLGACAICQRRVAEFRDVAALLAEATLDEEPSPELRARILDAALESPEPARAVTGANDADGGLGDEPVPTSTGRGVALGLGASGQGEWARRAGDGELVDLGERRARRRVQLRTRLLASAAAVVVVVGGVVGGLIGTSGGPRTPPANCGGASGCSEVVLTSAVSHREVATVMVDGTTVWIRPRGLAVDDTARQIYVLWEITGHEAPKAIGGFDVTAGARRAIAVGSLASPYSRASAFAVSLQKGRTIPPAPSRPVAVGRIT